MRLMSIVRTLKAPFRGLRGSVRLRLLISVMLFSSLVTLTLTAVQLYLDYHRGVENIEGRLADIETSYLASLGEGLWRLDHQYLQIQVEGIRRLSDIQAVEVHEAATGREPLVLKAGERAAHAALAREFAIFYPVEGREQLIGSLYVEATFTDLYRELVDTALVILVTQGLKTFLVSLFIIYIVHRLLTRHLAALAAFLHGYDLDHPPPPFRLRRETPRDEDELEQVSAAFNALCANLQQAYRDLREREARIRRLVDSNLIGIIFWDLAGKVTEANDAFLALVGYGREELRAGRIQWTGLTPPEHRAADLRAMEEIKASGQCTPYEKEYLHKDGSRVPVLLGGAMFEHPRDEGVAFVLDLTRRKQDEAALVESHAQLAAILDSALDAIITTDAEQRILLFNRAAEQMFGCPAAQAIGAPLERFIPARFRAVHRAHVARFGHVQAPPRRMGVPREVVGLRTSGEEFPVDASISQAECGGQKLFTVMLHDISERRRTEAERQAREAAEAANRAKSAFLASMTHELRTPLNAVLGYARLLQREPDLGERQANGLAIIEQSGEHLLDLINDVLDLAKVEAGRLDLAPLPLKLAAFLSAVAHVLRVKGEEKGLPVVLEASPELPSTVLADARRLRQILLNLLGNAVKFTDRGEVRLRVGLLAREEDVVRLRFEVVDTGVGVAADELKDIFQRFEQAGDLARRASGTGLGLAISQQLVRLMGSDIQVESTPGAGSRFWFDLSLPVLVAEPTGAPADATDGAGEMRAAEPLSVPPRGELEVLHRLARAGNMRAIRQQAELLAGRDVRYRPFAEHLEQLAKRYQSKAILKWIERCLESSS